MGAGLRRFYLLSKSFSQAPSRPGPVLDVGGPKMTETRPFISPSLVRSKGQTEVLSLRTSQVTGSSLLVGEWDDEGHRVGPTGTAF